MFWKKHKEKKVNKEFEEIQDDVKLARALGTHHIYTSISTTVVPMMKNWCEQQGCKIEVDHIDENGKEVYKIWGWE